MAAGAAPEVPVLAYLVVGLLAMLSWIVLRGLAGAWRHTIGWLLVQLGGILRIDVAFVHWHPGNKLIDLSNAMLHVITLGAAKSEHAMGYFFHGAAVLQEWATRELLHFAHESLGWATWLEHVHIPRLLKTIATVAVPAVLIGRLVRAAVAAAIPRLVHVAHAAAHGATVTITQRVAIPHLAEWQWLHRHWKALTVAIATSGAGVVVGRFPWAHVFPRIRTLEREGLGIRKRLRKVEALLGATGLAIAIANVLGLPNWRCLTRGNIGRTARALCGLDSELLGLLLAGIVALETPLSIEELAHEYASVIDDVVKGVGLLVSEVEAVT